jgi:hypothetical protein
VETDEVQVARAADVDREACPRDRSAARPVDARSILGLQRSAGNRAVGALLASTAQPPGAGDAVRAAIPVQRQPTGPDPDAWAPEPVRWPEEAEGERNEPCFDEDAKASIVLGSVWANSAATDLTSMPPLLEDGNRMIAWALSSWEGVLGVEPGQAALGEAMDLLREAGTRVSAVIAPVNSMLEQLSTAAVTASSEASAAATMSTRPAGQEGEYDFEDPDASEPPRPCFDDGQQALIADAVRLADTAATELSRRPPDYRHALTLLQNAAGALAAIGGEEPGQAKLTGAIAMLDRVIAGVDAYLTPVETVVADAGADVKSAVARANEASEMAKRGRYAPGGDEPPEG